MKNKPVNCFEGFQPLDDHDHVTTVSFMESTGHRGYSWKTSNSLGDTTQNQDLGIASLLTAMLDQHAWRHATQLHQTTAVCGGKKRFLSQLAEKGVPASCLEASTRRSL